LLLPPPHPTATAASAAKAVTNPTVAAERAIERCGVIDVSGKPV
jgi:hypothetical protein